MSNHVSMAFCKASDSSLIVFATGVVNGLKDNPDLFKDPPVSPATLDAKRESFIAAVGICQQGSVAQTLAKNSLRAELISLLRELAAFVEGEAKGDATVIRAAGFDVTTRGYHPQTALEIPTSMRVRFGKSTELILSVKRVKNAKCFEVQIRVGNGPWQTVGAFPNSKKMILENLVPGTVYGIRVRAVGGSRKYSGWSDEVLHMAI